MATTTTRYRYAVAPFSGGHGLDRALRSWRADGLGLADYALVGARSPIESLLGLRMRPVGPAAGRLRPALDGPAAYDWPVEVLDRPITPLGVSGKDGGLFASVGPFADFLIDHRKPGVTRFDQLVGQWLPSRFAAGLSDRLEGGAVLLWTGLADNAAERRTCQALLRHGDGTVQVHDFID